MSLFAIGVIGFILCFVLIFMRTPIYMAFALVGFAGIAVVRGWDPAFTLIATNPYGTASMYVWTVVPLFIFMGFLALHTDLAKEFFTGVQKWIGHFRGGLALSVIVGNAGFGACTGVPIGAAVTFTALCLPEMRKFGYNDKLTLGAVAAGSNLSTLIPPSLGFILYGALTENSVGQLFIAGVIPGVLLTLLFGLAIFLICWHDPSMGPPGVRVSWKERWNAGAGMWALIAVFVIIIGGIFIGLFTPTEAGGAGAFAVLAIGLLRRKLSWKNFVRTLRDTGIATGQVGMLFIGTMVLNVFLVITGVAANIADFLGAITSSPTATVWIIVIAVLILGCFIDALALTLIMIPILYPIIVKMGIDPIHFGVIFCIAMISGCITPPFGITVYAVAGVANDVPLFDIFVGCIPFLLAIFVLLVLVIHVPAISLFLPHMMY
jgi:C4-dicarboxylate transporter, DctM subunit